MIEKFENSVSFCRRNNFYLEAVVIVDDRSLKFDLIVARVSDRKLFQIALTDFDTVPHQSSVSRSYRDNVTGYSSTGR